MPLRDLLNVTPVDTKASLFEKGIPHNCVLTNRKKSCMIKLNNYVIA